MPLQHVVKRGDSLWGLSGRHLGNFERWPELVKYHNDEVRKSAGNSSRVFPIKDPNVIFVGQILYLPIRDKHMMRTVSATGTKSQAGNRAVPIDLRVKYTIGQSGKPIVYSQQVNNQTISIEMRGTITIKIVSPDRYRHNLELLMSKNETHCRQKLNEAYIPAFRALTVFHRVSLAGNSVLLSPQGPAKNSLPNYKIPLTSNSSGKMQGNLKDLKSGGKIEVEGKQYMFNYDIELIVNVHSNPDKFKDQPDQSSDGFFSKLGRDLKGAGGVLVDHFGKKDNWREIGQAFGDAGKIALISHGGAAIKAYIIFDVATGGVMTTATMVAAGTPAGQKIITEFIPSMNPGTLPSLTNYGVAGYLTGTTIETVLNNN